MEKDLKLIGNRIIARNIKSNKLIWIINGFILLEYLKQDTYI
jgi:hypothetical protein